MNYRKTQKDRILEHLVDNGTITSWEAIKEYGVTRLSHIILLLRKEYNITTELVTNINRYGDKVVSGIYTLHQSKVLT